MIWSLIDCDGGLQFSWKTLTCLQTLTIYPPSAFKTVQSAVQIVSLQSKSLTVATNMFQKGEHSQSQSNFSQLQCYLASSWQVFANKMVFNDKQWATAVILEHLKQSQKGF